MSRANRLVKMNILAEYNDSIIIQDTEYQFLQMIRQYSFDYWLREGSLTGLDLNLHTSKIITTQDIGFDEAHVDLLLKYLNICVFPTNDLNYKYNVGTVVAYYSANNAGQIMKTVEMQINGFVRDSIQFGLDQPLELEYHVIPYEDDGEEEDDDGEDDGGAEEEEEGEQHIIDELFEMWRRNEETATTEIPVKIQLKYEENVSDSESCPICLSDDSYIQTNCHHCFCDCVITHCLKNKSCPLCRTTVTELVIQDKKSFRIISSCLKYNECFTLP